MYWCPRVAGLVKEKSICQFVLITTSSIKNPSSRKVVDTYLKDDPQLSIVMARPAHHPWTGTKALLKFVLL